MIKTRLVKNASGTADLCETFSTEGRKLLQEETGVTYGASVVDVVAGYNEDGSPFSRFTYHETNELDDTNDTEEEADHERG